MKQKTPKKSSDSLKTFYLYAAFVIIIIVSALIVKLISVFLQSTFDGQHHYTVAFTQNNSVKQILAFSPQVPSIAILVVKDSRVIPYKALRKEYGISPDSQIEVGNTISLPSDVDKLLWDSLLKYPTIKTNATFVDLTRLVLLARQTVLNNRLTRDINLLENSAENNTIIARAMDDPMISSESVSIQIVNASSVTGLGQQLGRILTNLGANVVDVTTSPEIQKSSQIKYFGNQTYTLNEVEALTNYPVAQLTKQTIANIVIIIGEDTGKKGKF